MALDDKQKEELRLLFEAASIPVAVRFSLALTLLKGWGVYDSIMKPPGFELLIDREEEHCPHCMLNNYSRTSYSVCSCCGCEI